MNREGYKNEGRTDGCAEGHTDGHAEGRKDSRAEGRTDGYGLLPTVDSPADRKSVV